MLSTGQYKIIEEQLSRDNSKEFVRELIRKYANSVENIGELLNYIPKLAVKQLEIKQKRINQYSWGMDLVIADRVMHPGEYKKEDNDLKFDMLLYTCKAHFTDGNSKNYSGACKDFFLEFIDMLGKKKGFDYTNNDDWDWIYNTAECADWLESVIKQILIAGL